MATHLHRQVEMFHDSTPLLSKWFVLLLTQLSDTKWDLCRWFVLAQLSDTQGYRQTWKQRCSYIVTFFCLRPFVSKIMYHLKAASAVPRIGMYRPFLSLVSREQPATAVTIITWCLFYWAPFYDATAVTIITGCLFYIGPPFYDATAVTIITGCLFLLVPPFIMPQLSR